MPSTHMIETFYEDERGHEQTVRVHFEAIKGQPQTLEEPAVEPEIEIYKVELKFISAGLPSWSQISGHPERVLEGWLQECWDHLAEITESENGNA